MQGDPELGMICILNGLLGTAVIERKSSSTPTGGKVAQLPAGFSVLKTGDERVLQKVRCCCAEQILRENKAACLGLEEKDDLYEASK